MGVVNTLKQYPASVFFMLGNEFCERFSFYGMKAMLFLYLQMEHNLEEHTAKAFFHAFVFLAYFTPLLGSILADSYLGRFKVILYLSIVYVFGHVLLSSGAVPSFPTWLRMGLDYSGLFVIALGTGGIKPCVSAFAADQFDESQKSLRSQFFSFFYFAINAGSIIAFAIGPILRNRKCLGYQYCYPLAFGVPGVLMLLALIIFLIGWKSYKKEPPSGENALWMVCRCIFLALSRMCSNYDPPATYYEGSTSKRALGAGDAEKSDKSESAMQHSGDLHSKEADEQIRRAFDGRAMWLDKAYPEFTRYEILSVKSFLYVIITFLPMIVFWTLFDQQSSTWYTQGYQMKTGFFGWNVTPEQINILNPIFILILVPILEFVVYPIVKKIVRVTPLRKMALGGVIASVSFAIAALVQLWISATTDSVASDGHGFIRFLNAETPLPDALIVGPAKNYTVSMGGKVEVPVGEYQVQLDGAKTSMSVSSEKLSETAFYERNEELFTTTYSTEQGTLAQTTITLIQYPGMSPDSEVYIMLNEKDEDIKYLIAQNSTIKIKIPDFARDKYLLKYGVCDRGADCPYRIELPIDTASIFVAILSPNGTAAITNVYSGNHVHLLWQIPQLFLITLGEALLSITGLEFAYSQSTPEMKSVLQAMWLMTVALGNLINFVGAEARPFKNPIYELLAYSGLMLAVMIIFIILAIFYQYIPGSLPDELEGKEEESDGQDSGERSAKSANKEE